MSEVPLYTNDDLNFAQAELGSKAELTPQFRHCPYSGMYLTLIPAFRSTLLSTAKPYEMCCGYRGGLVFKAHRLVYHSA